MKRTRVNQYTAVEYILYSIIWTFIVLVWYNNLFFRNIVLGPVVLNYRESRNLLWLLIGICLPAGIAFTVKRCRTKVNHLVNILLPFEIYTVLAYFELRKALVAGFLILAGVLVLVFLILFVIAAWKVPAGSGKVRKLRIYKASMLSRDIIAAVLLCIPAFLLMGLLSETVITSGVSPASAVNEHEKWTLENQADTVRLLEEDLWNELGMQERLDVLQVIVNIESGYLGVPYEMTVEVSNLDETTLGQYSELKQRIQINAEHLYQDDPMELVDTVLHECRHAYQYACISVYDQCEEQYKELLLFQATRYYAEEFADYKDGKENIEAYYNQFCEYDARQYAETALEKYAEFIGY